jgi:hypothetical protein
VLWGGFIFDTNFLTIVRLTALKRWTHSFKWRVFFTLWRVLTLILLTWKIWWAPNNASKRQMAFKGLKWSWFHTSGGIYGWRTMIHVAFVLLNITPDLQNLMRTEQRSPANMRCWPVMLMDWSLQFLVLLMFPWINCGQFHGFP